MSNELQTPTAANQLHYIAVRWHHRERSKMHGLLLLNKKNKLFWCLAHGVKKSNVRILTPRCVRPTWLRTFLWIHGTTCLLHGIYFLPMTVRPWKSSANFKQAGFLWKVRLQLHLLYNSPSLLGVGPSRIRAKTLLAWIFLRFSIPSHLSKDSDPLPTGGLKPKFSKLSWARAKTFEPKSSLEPGF